MKKKTHGIISLILTSVALCIGIIAISLQNYMLTIVYGILVMFGFAVMLYSYCSKCVARFDCAHIIPGKATKFLPSRKISSYKYYDYLGVLIPFVIIVTIPQFWLWKTTWMFFLFWFLFVIAIIEIRTFICTGCVNLKCPACRNKCNTEIDN